GLNSPLRIDPDLDGYISGCFLVGYGPVQIA
ncbi:unnamed protein product, partial [marine sediment metagenome]